MNHEILTRKLADGGPYYRETDLSHWIAEPWNAASSLVFIGVAVFFFLRVRKDMKRHWFLALASPVMLAGGIGGTLYHAFRSSPFFLALDVVPIYLLTFGVAFFLWLRILPKWYYAAGILALFLASDYFIFYATGLKENIKQSVSYANLGLLMIIPLVWVLVKEKAYAGIWALAALGFYSLGLTCRVMDAAEPPIFPMGTHFLWHILCAAGTSCLGYYVFRLGNKPPQLQPA